MTNAPAGWYPDGSGQQRYWDGTQWTEHFAPAPAPAPAPATPATPISPAGRSRKPLWIGLGIGLGAGIVLAILLSILPPPGGVLGYLKATWLCTSSSSTGIPPYWSFDGRKLQVGSDPASYPESYSVQVSGNDVWVNDYKLTLPASAADGVQSMTFVLGDADPVSVQVTKTGNTLVFGTGTANLLTCAKVS